MAVSNISKANVCPYYGREIPGWESLGLEPDRIYQLLRDPGELAKAASTFNNLPVLSKHIPVTADDHHPDIVVGSTGTDAAFSAPYLQNSLVIWSQVAIDGIQSGQQREISSAYRYVPDMTPGVYEGVPYDGVMREIQGNHVALVEVGRAGPDVVVQDSQPLEFSKMKRSVKAIAVKAALGAYLRPKLAQDAAIDDLGALVRSVKKATLAQDKARIAKAVKKAAEGKLAKDAALDEAELEKVIQLAADEADDPAEDEDDEDDDDKKKPAEDEDDEDEDVTEDEDDEGPPDTPGTPKKPDAAMDAAIKRAKADAEASAVKRFNSIREAESIVRPLIGEVVAQDSAEAVYKLALDAANVDLKGVHPSAYKSMVKMLAAQQTPKTPRVAMDSSVEKSFYERFPMAKRS